MSLLIGDTGKAQIGLLKSYAITPGTARETLLTGGSILTLPTTEPATAQVSFTVQSSDLPTIPGNVPMKYNVSLVCSGKIGVAASVVNYRVLKNGVSVAQAAGASATATQFWTHTHWRTFDVQLGDVLDVKYWAVQSDVTLDFYGLIAYPSQPMLYKQGMILKDLTFSNVINSPTFTTTFSVPQIWNFFTYPLSVTTAISIGTGTTAYPAIVPNNTYGLFRTAQGENSASNTDQRVSATQRQMAAQYYPSNISFREVLR